MNNKLSHCTPYDGLSEFQKHFASVFGGNLLNETNRLSRAWAPLVDIMETEKEFIIKAELPGVTKENLKLSVENNMLLLAGERVEEKESTEQHYHHIERSYGSFSRAFQLPETADAEQIDASFKDGILKVRLPKTEKAQPKQIDVKIQ